MSPSIVSDTPLREISRAVRQWIAAAGTVPLSKLCAEIRAGSAEILAAAADPDLRGLVEILSPAGTVPAAAHPECVYLRQRLHTDSLHVDQIRRLRCLPPRRFHSGLLAGQPP